MECVLIFPKFCLWTGNTLIFFNQEYLFLERYLNENRYTWEMVCILNNSMVTEACFPGVSLLNLNFHCYVSKSCVLYIHTAGFSKAFHIDLILFLLHLIEA